MRRYRDAGTGNSGITTLSLWRCRRPWRTIGAHTEERSMTSLPIDQMIDTQRGLISREIFVSPEFHKQELERLFSRAWLFVGHESQIPKPGDYFVSRMGD